MRGQHTRQAGFSIVELLVVSICVLLLGSIIVTAIIDTDPSIEAHRVAYEVQQKHVEDAALADYYKGELGEGESTFYYVSRSGLIAQHTLLDEECIVYGVVVSEGSAEAVRKR